MMDSHVTYIMWEATIRMSHGIHGIMGAHFRWHDAVRVFGYGFPFVSDAFKADLRWLDGGR